MNFADPVDPRVRLKESKKKVKYQDLARELKKKPIKNQSNDDIISYWRTWHSNQKIDKGTGGF